MKDSHETESPQTERAREFYKTSGPRTLSKPTTVRPGKFSDGQDRDGTPAENVHLRRDVPYEHSDAKRYREDLRGGKPVATQYRTPPKGAAAVGNYHQVASRKGKK